MGLRTFQPNKLEFTVIIGELLVKKGQCEGVSGMKGGDFGYS